MQKFPRVTLLIESSHEYGRGLLSGIARYCRFHGPWIFNYEPKGQEKVKLGFHDPDVDGVISHDSGQIIATHRSIKLGTYHITTDHEGIANMAADYFLRKGYKNFAYCGLDDKKLGLCGVNKVSWSFQRGEFFKKRLIREGFDLHLYPLPKSKRQCIWDNEREFVVNWLRTLPKPIALFACNDIRSRNVSEACAIEGLRVPEDVAILGVDNDALLCELSNPSLSSIALSAEKAGYLAAELLDKLMAGKKIKPQSIKVKPTHVMERHSTDTLAIEDDQVVNALRFIHLNSKKPIQVSDVVDATTLSRRALERRFKTFLGCSILDEIRRVHLEEIVKMLIETRLSIEQIGNVMGYSSVSNMRSYFKKVKGVSPSEYRKRYGII